MPAGGGKKGRYVRGPDGRRSCKQSSVAGTHIKRRKGYAKAVCSEGEGSEKHRHGSWEVGKRGRKACHATVTTAWKNNMNDSVQSCACRHAMSCSMSVTNGQKEHMLLSHALSHACM